jgi:hypothetical protein
LFAFEHLEATAVRPGEDVRNPREIAIEEIDRASLRRSGRIIAGDDAGHGGCDRCALVRVEEPRIWS